MSNTDTYFNNALKIVMEAGEILLKGFKSPKDVMTKQAYYDLVTQYDILVEKTIIDNLLQLYPNHKFIAEESQADAVLTNEPTWILDPIDGTTNFVQGFPFCCISLALVVENDIIIGIVYNPITNQLFTAQKGKGAYLNNERIHVSDTEDIKDAMFGFDVISIKENKNYFMKHIDIIIDNFRGSRSLGSAAITLCYLAMGAMDICSFQYLKCWDVVAGILIIQEAGGIILDSKGSNYKDIMNADIIAVSKRKLAEDFLKLKNNYII
ncbi:Hypothetical protein CINCED_3A019917 [Cinara cedri]|uniref:Inositol-1-monophosphatase n=1 Tax=Cinara cedri TaxID=506608 RepID=A0A5E4N5P3_9HEMI|nr:Hypothetical protein CINCED_3A019917 [Cinara cedri]